MKKKLLSLIISLLSIATFAQVKFSLLNDTGSRLDSLTVEGVYIGTIEKDSTKTITCKSVVADGKIPILTISAKYLDKKVEHYKIIECGTFVHTISQGEYSKRLVIVPYGDGTSFIAATTIRRKKP